MLAYMVSLIWVGVTISRLLLPVAIVKKYTWAIWLSLLMDMIDWELLPLGNTISYELYQQWDKALDNYLSGCLVLYLLQVWQQANAKRVAVMLFFIRSLGVFLFAVTSSRSLLFIFPDLFLTFFLTIEVCLSWLSTSLQLRLMNKLPLMLGLLLTLKLLQEFVIHVSQKLPWQWAAGQFFAGDNLVALYLNILIWVGLFVSLHLGVIIASSVNMRQSGKTVS